MNTVGYVLHWHLGLRPAGEERLKDPPAHRSMQTTHPVNLAASSLREIRHIERLGTVERVSSSQSQQLVEVNPQLVGIPAEILPHQLRLKTVEAGFHRGVGRKKVSGPGHGKRNLERWVV